MYIIFSASSSNLVSARHRAGTRGIRIAKILEDKPKELKNVDIRKETKVFGIYNGIVAAVQKNEKLLKIEAKKIVVAT